MPEGMHSLPIPFIRTGVIPPTASARHGRGDDGPELGQVPDAGRTGRLRGHGKVDARAVPEDDGPVLVGYGPVHQRRVSVALRVRLQPLVWTTPAHVADLLARQYPLRVAVKPTPEVLHVGRVHQVDERISEARPRLEVNREVEEVVLRGEALAVEQIDDHRATVVVRQVPEHHGRASIHGCLSRPDALLFASGASGRGCRCGVIRGIAAALAARERLRPWSLRGHHEADWDPQ
mmetsp:Transcript_117656/g.313003  ORF Transcript_117656/g.313003 Transcript_117656/m.313003 type:complete len:234 (-) Transcript_117656:675-1376(-)